MKLIVGLGNPGEKYEITRHNIGKIALKELTKRISGTRFKKYVVLSSPRTYMNVSGPAVLDLMKKHRVTSPSDLLVLVDDLHLPFGKIRFRAKGSAGGHNGLASIIDFLGSESFPRIRIGVGKPEKGEKNWKDYVLEPFTNEELEELDPIMEKVCDVAFHWLAESDEKSVRESY